MMRTPLTSHPRLWILLVAGINLILAQYWTMREYMLLMASSEVSLLLVTVAFLASCSVGYRFAPHRLGGGVRWICLGLAVIHLLFPWLLKEAVGWAYWLELPLITLWLMAFATAFMAPLYTIFLPFLIERLEADQAEPPGDAVMVCYGIELVGALVGILAILTLGRWGLSPLVTFYFVNLSLLLAFVFEKRMVLAAALPVALCYGLTFSPVDHIGAEHFYRRHDDDPDIRLLASTQSLYNRIDVVRTGDGQKLLRLNGREYFNPTDLEAFNRYLAGIPSALAPGGRVLIVGTGSLSSAYHASRTARSVESVEIDAQVVRLTKDLFREFNHLDQVDNWRLHIDDAKHYLGTTNARYDLIAVDLVPPVYVQTALLFTKEFYALAKSRLTSCGVLSIYTGHIVDDANLSNRRYVAEKTVDTVFADYLVVNSQEAGMAFVYASDCLPYSKATIEAFLAAQGQAQVSQVLTAKEVRPLMTNNRAASTQDLGIVVEWAPSSYRLAFATMGWGR